MRTSLARPAFVNVIVRDNRPGEVVVAKYRAQGRDPCSGRRDIWLDSAIFARTAARKISNDIDAVAVNEKIGSIVVGCRSGDHIFGNSGATDGLTPGSGVARRKLQDIRLI